LAEAIIDVARVSGYTTMRLDTIGGRMDRAIALYRELGFIPIQPYKPNPMPEAMYMELRLAN
jgi:hypothetical protein